MDAYIMKCRQINVKKTLYITLVSPPVCFKFLYEYNRIYFRTQSDFLKINK